MHCSVKQGYNALFCLLPGNNKHTLWLLRNSASAGKAFAMQPKREQTKRPPNAYTYLYTTHGGLKQ